jgi:hypothetical protein
MIDDSDVPYDEDPYGTPPPKGDWPPNTYWNDKTKVWNVLPPPKNDKQIARYKRLGINANSSNPGGYDHTWGYGDSGTEADYLDPWGDTEEDQWLKSVYEKQGWTLPSEEGPPPPPPPPNGDGPTEVPTEDYGTYRYFGTDPHQDWEVDLGYLKPAPQFEFEAEPWVAPEAFEHPAYQRPEDFSYAPFVLPSGEEVLTEDPGYQFRRDEGLRAMEASAARRGTLLGGATIKGLIDYGSNVASQEYEKAVNRRLQGYQTNLGREQQAYATNLGAGQWGYETNLGAAERAYGTQAENAYNEYITNYNNRYGLAQDRYKAPFRTWEEEQLAGRQASRDQWGRQWDAYEYGQPSGTTMYTYPGPQMRA